VGRIVADSTWHHQFDINLRGELGNPDRTGFVVPGTGQWLSTATKIEHYFLNAAIWLAPPAKQAAMRFAAWWPALWSAGLVQLDVRTPLSVLGGTAWDALGRHAPQCVVFGWIWDLVPIEAQKYWLELLNRPDAPPPVHEYLAGVATRELIRRFEAGPDSRPGRAPDEEAFHEVLRGAAVTALEELTENRSAELDQLRELTDRARKG
jgi:hypothetical protein